MSRLARRWPSRSELTYSYLLLLNALAVPVVKDGALSPTVLLASLGLVAVLATLSAIDTLEFRLPDALTLPLAAAGVLLAWWAGWDTPQWRLLSAAAGYAFIWAAASAYRYWRGRDGIGMGDAKLMAAAGAWLGLAALPSVLLWACMLALFAVAVARRLGIETDAHTRLPFGPFIAFGFWLVWLYGPLV